MLSGIVSAVNMEYIVVHLLNFVRNWNMFLKVYFNFIKSQ